MKEMNQRDTVLRNACRLSSVLLIVMVLVGCGKAESTAAAETGAETNTGAPPGGMDPTSALALGTLKLEESEHAVTAAQAAELLPLWQAIQSGALEGSAETEAVLRQIEGKMTAEQMAAIEAMELTFQGIQTWMEEQGIEMPSPMEGQPQPDGEMPARPEGGPPGGDGAFGDMSEEERATRMAEMDSERPEGRGPGGGQGGEWQDGQGMRPGGGTQSDMLIAPLIDLLTERAGQ